MAGSEPYELPIKVKLDIEPTEKAKDFVRQVVIETLKEVLTDPTWLEAHIDQAVDAAIDRNMREALAGSAGKAVL